MVEYLFLDLDDTILDFHGAERVAIAETLRMFGAEPTEAVLARYHVINIAHWKLLEQGKMLREEVLVHRFAQLFEELRLEVDAEKCARTYEKQLAMQHGFLPGALETVQALSREYRLFLATNGTASVQAGRLSAAGLRPYFEQIFISQEIGFNKPAVEFFARAFAQIPDFDPGKALMVGDSLSSDILGGINAGIRTCWVNPSGAAPQGDIRADYEVRDITQLPALLNTL